jgi:hypothetical protein
MFKLFGKKDDKTAEPAPTVKRHVVIEGQKTTIAPTTPRDPPAMDPLRQRLLFQGLHEDTNPSENVRVSNMTCPSCATSFRYFLNSDGKKTVVKCPSCTKTFRL